MKNIRFCKNCNGLLFPTEENGIKILKCRYCNSIKFIDDKIKEEYIWNKKIE